MSHLPAIDPAVATGKTKELLDTVKGSLGLVPNMTRVMVNSPAVLQGYLGFHTALASGQLDGKTRESIALLIAQQNGCDYCLSAHTAIGKMVGLNPQQVLDSRHGNAESAKTAAALQLAATVLSTRGKITPAELDRARAAGLNDGEIAEVIAHVAINVFTNYFNNATEVEIDFPRVLAAELK